MTRSVLLIAAPSSLLAGSAMAEKQTYGHLDFFSFQRCTSVRAVEVGKETADWRAGG